MTPQPPTDVPAQRQRQDALAKRVCKRLGADYAGGVVRGADWATNMRSYEIVGARARAARGRIDYLHVRKSGNFGNNIIQLINAALLAERFGIRYVSHRTDWMTAHAARRGPSLVVDASTLAGAKAGLSGTFFLASAIATLRDQPPDRLLRVFETYVRPGFALKPDRSAGICLNLRGGYDVFENPAPNQRYGQPPLSFYQSAVSNLIAKHGPQPIEIVHQDDRNPVLHPLITWAKTTGHPLTVTSAGPEGDACAMLSARHLVIGWTSFSAALALFSPDLESLTVFRAAHLQDVLRRALPHLYLVEDQAGGYFGQARWNGSDRQRQMMLAYPADALRTDDIAMAPDRRGEDAAGMRIRRAALGRNALSRLGLARF